MKFMKHNSKGAKILAVVLCTVMAFTALNVGSIANVFAIPYTGFIVEVTDEAGTPIEGAKVKLVPTDENIVIESLDVVTESNGKAYFNSVKDYFEANAEITEFNAIYTVTAENYQTASITEEKAITVKAEGSTTVKLKEGVKPVIKEVIGNATEWTKGSITLTVVSEDADVAGYMIVKEGSQWQTEKEFTVSANGTYIFAVKDTAGNISDQVSIVVEKIDNEAPEIKGVAAESDEWTVGDVKLIVTAEDKGCGNIQYKMDDGQWQTENFFTVNGVEQHTFYVKDALGNETSVVANATNIDTEAPVIQSVVIPDVWTNTSVEITVNAIDSKSGVSQYKLDDGQWQTENKFVIADGEEHTVYVKDVLGNVADTKVIISKFDKVAPVISEVTPEDGWSNTSIKYTVSATDDKSGVKEYGIAVTGSEDIEWVKSSEAQYVFTITDTQLYTFYVKDNAGNVAKTNVIESANIEKEAPVISGVTVDPVKWTNDKVALTVVASDNGGSGIKAYRIDGKAWQTNATFENITDDAEHKFEVIDNAGNISAVYMAKADNFDSGFPVISEVTPEDGWSNESIDFTVKATDEKSGVAEYGVSVKESTDITWVESFEAQYVFTITDTQLYTFYVKDNAGNVTTYTMTVPAQIEKEAPVISDVVLSTTNWTNQPIDFTVVASDNGGSNIKAYRIDGKEWQTDATFKKIADDTEHKFEVIDNAGNISAVYVKNAQNYDNTNPEITNIKPSTTEWTNADITVEIEVSDDKSGVELYRVDGGNWQEENSFTINDRDEHKFEVKDKAGNISAVSTYTADNYDVELPEIDELKPSTTDWTNKTIIITVNASDEISGVKEYKMDEGQWQTANTFEIEDRKEHKFYVKDNAGNVSEVSKYTSGNYDVKAVDKLTNVEITQTNDSAFARILNFITFGNFFKEETVITVTAEDVKDSDEEMISNASGIKSYSIYLYTENGDLIHREEGSESNVFTISKNEVENFKGTIAIAILDNAGNMSDELAVIAENSSLDNDIDWLMIENDAPVISDIEQITPEYEAIHKDAFEFKFTVSDIVEGKYISGINSVQVIANDKLVLLDDQKLDGKVVLIDDLTDDESEITAEKEYVLVVDPAEQTINGVKLVDDNNNDLWNKGFIEIKVNAYDNAGNKAIEKKTVAYFDQNSPVIAGFDFSLTESIDVEKDEESKLFNSVTIEDYGFYFKEDVTVTIYAKDLIGANETVASGVKYITYKAVDISGKIMYSGNNVEVDENGSISFDILKEDNFKGQIYAYATDMVGNTPTDCVTFTDELAIKEGEDKGFAHPNGTIVESLEKHKETSDITITAPLKTDTQNNAYAYNYGGAAVMLDAVKDYDDSQLVPLYNSNITFNVSVKDTYAGIRSVKWTIFEGEAGSQVVTEKEVTVDNDGVLGGDSAEWTIVDEEDTDNLVYGISANINVTGNHNNMVLLVELTDRAGNTSYDYYVFGIDTVLPVIKVQYNDNEAINDDTNTDFFRTDRVATITITERNFRAENVAFAITSTDNVIPEIDLKNISVWTENVDETDLDKTTYTAVINYTADGDYTFDIACTDNAKNANNGVDFGDSIAPQKFTVDKTLPVVTVTFNNNSAQNGNYYKADRTATITIVEHNFDSSRVQILEKIPAISRWTSKGDTHTATIVYDVDGRYALDIEFNDMAGNLIKDFAKQEFVIDKTNPVVEITGIVDQSANNSEGTIGFILTATDTNYNGFTPVLTAVTMKDNKFETNTIDIGEVSNVENGQRYTVANIETDGIYSVTCTVVDKAGNEFTEVILQAADGKNYTEKRTSTDNLVTFSVNRKGSVFALESYATQVVGNYYLQNITEAVSIIEINADPIVENSVTLNGKKLVENEDYKVVLDHSNGTWYKYTYSLNKELFANESEYNIVISSKDKANNDAFSDVKDVAVKFVVDRTAPIVTVAGLKVDGRYQVEKQTVTLVPSDDGGSLKSLIVRTLDEDGNVIKELINLSGDALLEAMAAGNITFELNEGLYQNVQIICEDYAGNIIGAQENEVYSNVSISSSAFMIFWANKPLRWGVIGGGVGLIALIIVAIVLKNKKKD